MRIIIIGAGKVGTLLTKYIAAEGHDVVIVDLSAHKVEDVVNLYDVIGVTGNGGTKDVLMEAGADKADLAICVTNRDELNIMTGLIAKQLGTKNIIARVSNPEYSKQSDFLRNELGFSMIINPEMEAASEIVRVVTFPAAVKVDTFAKGKVELVEIYLDENSVLDGVQLSNLHKVTKANILICAVSRQGQVFIPDGNFVLQKKDYIHVAGLNRDLYLFCRDIKILKEPVRNAMVVGGGKLGYYLTKALSVQGIKVKLIEHNHERCLELAKQVPYATIIEADGSDEEVLLEEGIHKTDAFISLTGLDEENLVLCLYATRYVRKAIAKVTRLNLSGIVDLVGINSVITPKTIVANQIVRYVRANSTGDTDSSVQTLYKIVNDEVEALEFIATKKTKFLDTPLMDLKTLDNLLIVAVIRGNELIVPKGNTVIKENDHVIIVTVEHQINTLNDIIED